jgi:sulfate/thiosulfate transport system substrate-binding protein
MELNFLKLFISPKNNGSDRHSESWMGSTNLPKNSLRQSEPKFYGTRIFGTAIAVGMIGVSSGVILTSQIQLAASQPKTVEITLASFAVTKAAYEKIIPKFVEKWKKENGGQVIKFRESYGGSGSQTRAIIDGLDADVAHLALAIDTNRLQQSGLIGSGWEKEFPNNGIVARSVVALAVRPGNPKNIKDWADLAKPGIRLITANPKTSGVARWNFLGLWGSVTEAGGSEAKAKEFVTAVFKNVPILPRDAREATEVFLKQGQGDALLNYENELILSGLEGKVTPYNVPGLNISIDTPIAVIDRNVDKKGTRKAAEAFVNYLYSPESQREFARVGFRPVVPAIAKEAAKNFRPVQKLYTVDDLGGWDAVNRKFFADKAIFDQIRSNSDKRN